MKPKSFSLVKLVVVEINYFKLFSRISRKLSTNNNCFPVFPVSFRCPSFMIQRVVFQVEIRKRIVIAMDELIKLPCSN